MGGDAKSTWRPHVWFLMGGYLALIDTDPVRLISIMIAPDLKLIFSSSWTEGQWKQ